MLILPFYLSKKVEKWVSPTLLVKKSRGGVNFSHNVGK